MERDAFRHCVSYFDDRNEINLQTRCSTANTVVFWRLELLGELTATLLVVAAGWQVSGVF